MASNQDKKTMAKLVSGFTLVETLVAIAIFSLSILGTFTAVQGGLRGSFLAQDRIVAGYLVQEAIEYIKNTRDENTLRSFHGTPTNWLYGLSSSAGEPCYFGKICYIDSYTKSTNPAGTSVFECSGVCPIVNQHSSGLFGYGSGADWTATKYRRTIQFQNNAADKEVMVTVTIEWTSGSSANTYQITQLLFKVQ